MLGLSPIDRMACQVLAGASNFRVALDEIVAEFESRTSHRVTITMGSTGQLYAQIVNGAPFDVFLAADRERPRRLAEQGIGVPESVFTYATGRLALWSRDPQRIGEDSLATLADTDFRWLAMAEPAVAPYGAAARQVLETLGAWAAVEGRIVTGQNVAQAFAMAQTGNAELGLVALTYAMAYRGGGSYVVVPPEWHDPIRQDAVLLRRGASNQAALDFVEWLKSREAAAIVASFGYGAPAPGR
jgi:molybdate transport system substrate-binding protein